MTKTKVAIIGSGNIGTDLLMKVLRSSYLTCSIFIGRNFASPGINKARSLGVPVSTEGFQYIEKHPDCCEIVFDATSAPAHQKHAVALKKMGKLAIDLTPAKVGVMCVPAVNVKDCLKAPNINMVTCGGQASIPLAYVFGQTQREIEYLEVVSSISSRSAGPATRINLDEYIHTTEQGVKTFSGAHRTKAILNINPAVPCIDMQTTLLAKLKEVDMPALKRGIEAMVAKIQQYVPGYELIMGPIYEGGRVVVMVKVKGLGDYLPEYAGNLDIINCAAIAVAEEFAKK